MIKSTDMVNMPSAYHSHDYRRPVPTTKNSTVNAVNTSVTATKVFGAKTDASEVSQRIQMGIQSGRQPMR